MPGGTVLILTELEASVEGLGRNRFNREYSMGISVNITEGIAEVVMDNPPVNALTVAGWYELAEVLTSTGRNQEVGALVLRAEGRGWNAGVDIKEMQNTEGFDALLGANRGCYAAFAAVYEGDHTD